MIATILGIVGVGVNVLIFWQKNRRKMLLCKMTADFVWFMHYCLLGAFSGAAICGIGVFRQTVFLNNHKKWAKSKMWIGFFVIVNLISAFLTWKNMYSILPAVASVLGILSFWIGEPKLTRILQVPISVAFLIYNGVSGSTAGVFNEIITFTSLIFAMCSQGIPHMKLKKTFSN